MMPARPESPTLVAMATLALTPSMTPRRLQRLLDRWPDPLDALDALQCEPDATDVPDPAAVAALLARRRARVLVCGEPGYPIADELPDRPRVLFAEGDRLDAFDAPRVAIVGTRAATPHGLGDAYDLGAFLAGAGVTVLSGMAIGVDGAAHEGAIAAMDARGSGPGAARGPGVIGVVATGLDVEYPRRHAGLHDAVRRRGVLVSENPYGTRPHPSRFPVRNRIIAAVADAVVVVEATSRGGARITADHALEYGRPVLAIPGSRRNPAATGCNELLRDGAIPLLDPSDVLVALGITPAARREGWRAVTTPTKALSKDAAALLHALGGEPAVADQLATRTGLGATAVSLALDELRRAGRVAWARGFVWPR